MFPLYRIFQFIFIEKQFWMHGNFRYLEWNNMEKHFHVVTLSRFNAGMKGMEMHGKTT